MDKLITELDQVLFNYDLEHWGLIQLGDLNVDYNASNRNPERRKLQEFASKFNLTQIVSKPSIGSQAHVRENCSWLFRSLFTLIQV